MSAAGLLSLRGLRVLVTRPAHQAETLCDLLAQRGAMVSRLPLQRIDAVAPAAVAAGALQAAHAARYWIFTSANAVVQARLLDAGDWPPVIAVGGGTARALARLGMTAQIPEEASSEGVLALPTLQSVAGTEIGVISGIGGRDLIAQTLTARGAMVRRIDVYRRVVLPYAAEQIEAALQQVDVVVIGNGEALERLRALCSPVALAQLQGLPLVVPSRRVVELATEMGLRCPLMLPQTPADADFVQCLEQWRRATADERSR